MRSTNFVVFGLVITVVPLIVACGPANAAGEKATLCHVPPDDPSNVHEIVVGEKALEAHLKNHPGDHAGPCEEGCESGGMCDDANSCTVDVCNPDGSCDNSQAVDCDDGNPCTIDACDPLLGCVNPPVPDAEFLTCDDEDPCSSGDLCVAGQCTGAPIEGCCESDTDCPPDDACIIRFCDSNSTCRQADISGRCTAGACEVAFCDPVDGCGTTATTCPDDGDICTVAVCDPLICGTVGGCVAGPNPNPPEPDGELTCDDDLDNDCDGSVDCLDGDCASDPICTGADGQPCAAANECNSGYCVDQVCCNSVCSGDCETCNVGTCTYLPAATHICREQVGQCDVAEYCNGASGVCPPDSFLAPGNLCGDPYSPGTCDGTGVCIDP